ncbi:hypothetical protein NGR_c17700 [Sinorhizobium fredii NGR234]|uniref:Uncharacterized protein n=1 Tax=Sinorhizobium fredii (strain NBRC 101917 / NGR234) TaxID=394 RepID=C3MDL5_SINFN|nr:hypothetical protein NGR_c17700 [Sinorhizobium fredii NGR234]
MFTGSQISPLSCNRSVVAQSNPFQAQRSLWSVSHNSASTASSILSSSISILLSYHARDPQVPRPTSDGYFGCTRAGALDRAPDGSVRAGAKLRGSVEPDFRKIWYSIKALRATCCLNAQIAE